MGFYMEQKNKQTNIWVSHKKRNHPLSGERKEEYK